MLPTPGPVIGTREIRVSVVGVKVPIVMHRKASEGLSRPGTGNCQLNSVPATVLWPVSTFWRKGGSIDVIDCAACMCCTALFAASSSVIACYHVILPLRVPRLRPPGLRLSYTAGKLLTAPQVPWRTGQALIKTLIGAWNVVIFDCRTTRRCTLLSYSCI